MSAPSAEPFYLPMHPFSTRVQAGGAYYFADADECRVKFGMNRVAFDCGLPAADPVHQLTSRELFLWNHRGVTPADLDAIEREARADALAELRVAVEAEVARPHTGSSFNNGSDLAFGIVLGLIDKAAERTEP